ncbi:hypothetical protein CSB11_00725 [Candidatus Campbellbacteria bacterium]|nr:MAG: hypothetical protein CSB11_00725 [Candidatus Campbellbacteria bacterium]
MKKIKISCRELYVILQTSYFMYKNIDEVDLSYTTNSTKESRDKTRSRIIEEIAFCFGDENVKTREITLSEIEYNDIMDFLVEGSLSEEDEKKINIKNGEIKEIRNSLEERWTGLKKQSPPSIKNIFK